ncbi:MAG: hypothetical protein ACOCXA_04030, partial [Planctomycetota bacterium]
RSGCGAAAALSSPCERYRHVLGNRGSEELDDLTEDLHEWHNRIDDPEQAHVQSRWRREPMRLTGRSSGARALRRRSAS